MAGAKHFWIGGLCLGLSGGWAGCGAGDSGPPGGSPLGAGADGSSGLLDGGDPTGSAPGGTAGASGSGTLFDPATGGTGGGGGGAPATGGAAGAPPTGCGAPPPADTPADEACGNGLDDDLDGFIDENCLCTSGSTQPCFDGPPSQAGLPNCTMGSQSCEGSGEFLGWGRCEGSSCSDVPPPDEICDNGADDDCDGLIDEGCVLDAVVNIDGDCLAIFCPPQAPHPIGCDIVMEGNDSRGCVAHAPGHQAVYFQEGNACPILGLPFGDAGHISGILKCSTQLADPAVSPIGPETCIINKPDAIYTTSADACPT